MAGPHLNPGGGDHADPLRASAAQVLKLSKEKHEIEGTLSTSWLGRCWSGRKGKERERSFEDLMGRMAVAVNEFKGLLHDRVKVIKPPQNHPANAPQPLAAQAVQSITEICKTFQKTSNIDAELLVAVECVNLQARFPEVDEDTIQKFLEKIPVAKDKLNALTKLTVLLERTSSAERKSLINGIFILVKGSLDQKNIGNNFRGNDKEDATLFTNQILEKIKHIGPATFLGYARELIQLESPRVADLDHLVTLLRHVPEEQRLEQAAHIKTTLLQIPLQIPITTGRGKLISQILEYAVKLRSHLPTHNQTNPSELVKVFTNIATTKGVVEFETIYKQAHIFLKRFSYTSDHDLAELFCLLESVKREWKDKFPEWMSKYAEPLLKRAVNGSECNAILRAIIGKEKFMYQPMHALLSTVKEKNNFFNIVNTLGMAPNKRIVFIDQERIDADRLLFLAEFITNNRIEEVDYSTIFKIGQKTTVANFPEFVKHAMPFLKSIESIPLRERYIEVLSMYPMKDWLDVFKMYHSLLESTQSGDIALELLTRLTKVKHSDRINHCHYVKQLTEMMGSFNVKDLTNFITILTRSNEPHRILEVLGAIPLSAQRAKHISEILEVGVNEGVYLEDPLYLIRLLSGVSSTNLKDILKMLKSLVNMDEKRAFVVLAGETFAKIQDSTVYMDVISSLKALYQTDRKKACERFLAYIDIHPAIPQELYASLLNMVITVRQDELEDLVSLVKPILTTQPSLKNCLAIIKVLNKIPKEQRAHALELATSFVQAHNGGSILIVLQALSYSSKPADWSAILDIAHQHFNVPAEYISELIEIVSLCSTIPLDQIIPHVAAIKNILSATYFQVLIDMLNSLPLDLRVPWIQSLNNDDARRVLNHAADSAAYDDYKQMFGNFVSQESNREKITQFLFEELARLLPDQIKGGTLAERIIEYMEILGLHEEHPLYQKALEVRALTDIDKNNPKNPYILYQKLKEISKNEKLISQGVVASLQIKMDDLTQEHHVALDLIGFRKRAENKALTFEQLPVGVVQDDFEKLFKGLNERLSALPPAQRELLKAQVKTLTQGVDAAQLQDQTLGMGKEIPRLMAIKGAPKELVANSVFYLYSILEAIKKESPDRPSDTSLSPQEAMFLKFLSLVRHCSVGQRDGIALYYSLIQPGGENVATTAVEKVEKGIDKRVQLALDEAFASEKVLESISGGPVGQISHQTLYLKNRFAKQLGYIHSLSFDEHAGVIADQLIACTEAIDVDKGKGAAALQALGKILSPLPKALLESAKQSIANSLKAHAALMQKYTDAEKAYDNTLKKNAQVDAATKERLKKEKEDRKKELDDFSGIKFDDLNQYFETTGIKHAGNQWTDLFSYARDADGDIDFTKIEGITDMAALQIHKKMGYLSSRR